MLFAQPRADNEGWKALLMKTLPQPEPKRLLCHLNYLTDAPDFRGKFSEITIHVQVGAEHYKPSTVPQEVVKLTVHHMMEYQQYHHKLLVAEVDDTTCLLWIGSLHWTWNALHQNQESALVATVACSFNQLAKSLGTEDSTIPLTLAGGKKVTLFWHNNKNHSLCHKNRFKWNDTTPSTLLKESPSRHRLLNNILEAMKSAKNRIILCAYQQPCLPIMSMLEQRKDSGLIRIKYDIWQTAAEFWKDLVDAKVAIGIDCQTPKCDKATGGLHHHFIVIDDCAWIGSSNWSCAAFTTHCESTLQIEDSQVCGNLAKVFEDAPVKYVKSVEQEIDTGEVKIKIEP